MLAQHLGLLPLLLLGQLQLVVLLMRALVPKFFVPDRLFVPNLDLVGALHLLDEPEHLLALGDLVLLVRALHVL